jgi:hypothetical protein
MVSGSVGKVGVRRAILSCECGRAFGEVYLHPGGGIAWAPSRRGSGQPQTRPRSTDRGVPGAADAVMRHMVEIVTAYAEDGNDERALRLMYTITVECGNPRCRRRGKAQTFRREKVAERVRRVLDSGRTMLVVGDDL